jgi:ABC-type oligopeptide transport system ATPase subunit
LNLLKSLQDQLNLTYIFVTHHLLVVRYISQRVAVLYLGKVMELADTADFFRQAVHPYSQALLSAIPLPQVGGQIATHHTERRCTNPCQPARRLPLSYAVPIHY